MKRAVWKWSLPMSEALAEGVDVAMPSTTHLVSVQEQHGLITLWGLVEPDAPTVKRRFKIVGTGDRAVGPEDVYCGTVQMGMFVWHVFEVRSAWPGVLAAQAATEVDRSKDGNL